MKSLLVLLISFSAYAVPECYPLAKNPDGYQWQVCATLTPSGNKTIVSDIYVPMNGSPGALRTKAAAKHLCAVLGKSFVRFSEVKEDPGCFFDPKYNGEMMCFNTPVAVKIVSEVTCR